MDHFDLKCLYKQLDNWTKIEENKKVVFLWDRGMKAFQYSNGANLERTFLVHMTLEIPGHLLGRLQI
jgi:hypothetical protein